MSTDPDTYPALPPGVFCPVCSANNAIANQQFVAQLQRVPLYTPAIPVSLVTGVNAVKASDAASAKTKLDDGIALLQTAASLN